MCGIRNFRLGPTTIKYLIEERSEEGLNSFCIGDVLADLPECKKACLISDIYTEFACRNQGYAKAAVKRFIELMSPDMPILSGAAILKVDHPVKPSNEEWDAEIKWKSEFLEKIGFTNINKYVNYELKEAFLYVNEMTQPYIDACEKRIKEMEEKK